MGRPRKPPEYHYCLYCGDPLPEGRRSDMRFCRDREEPIPPRYRGETEDELRRAVGASWEVSDPMAGMDPDAARNTSGPDSREDQAANAHNIGEIMLETRRPKSCSDAWRTKQRHQAERDAAVAFTYGAEEEKGFVGLTEPAERFTQTPFGKKVKTLAKAAVSSADPNTREYAAQYLAAILHTVRWHKQYADLHPLILAVLHNVELDEQERKRQAAEEREAESREWEAKYLTSIEVTRPWDEENEESA